MKKIKRDLFIKRKNLKKYIKNPLDDYYYSSCRWYGLSFISLYCGNIFNEKYYSIVKELIENSTWVVFRDEDDTLTHVTFLD